MKITGWGRYPRIQARAGSFEMPEELAACLSQKGSWIAHGMGRSYGDSALNPQVVLSRRFNKILDFQPRTGVVTCESGVTLAELIDVFLPRGWFLAVTPGTKLITVGGAIASDVHGKNHHTAGCFSTCVEWFDLMLPNGEILRCSPTENRSLFLATCGGMGLTGVILTVRLRLQAVRSAYIRETVRRCSNLEEIFACFEEHQAIPYSVAWIDCLAKGSRIGRSVLMLGEHAESGRLNPPSERRLSVPVNLPGFCLNKYSITLFNHIYYGNSPAFVENRLTPLEPFFYPLDKIDSWNRMYGSGGFTQYQLVLPKQASREGLQEILARIADSGMGSFLAVLKLFGPGNENYLSFPMEGYTLALDFKIQRRLFSLLEQLDRIVLDFEGRLYLTKDVRMSRQVFRKGYPGYAQFAEIRSQYGLHSKMASLQSERLGV